MNGRRLLTLSTVALALASAASSQSATVILREGDELPGGSPGRTMNALSNTAVNQNNGWSATVNSTDGSTTLSHVVGAASGGFLAAASVLRTESTIGNLEQTAFESFFGMDDTGAVSYGPTTTNTVTLVTGLDALFLDDMLLANEGDPIPALPGKMYRFNSRPGVTGNGIPYWVGGIDDITTGSGEGNGLFVGTTAAAFLKSGDVVPGLPSPVSTGGIDFDVRMSANGTHYITGVDTDATTSADFFVLIDGLPITLGAGIIGEGQAIDPSVPGVLPAEVWSSFDFLGITEAGDYMLTGDTGAATTQDEFVFVNGAFYAREGDTIDGLVISGSIEGAYMNENGDVAYVWDVNDPVLGNIEALYINNTLALKEGDAVDFDGDGTVDANATVVGFSGISSLTLAPDGTAYVTVEIDTLGTTSTTDDTECVIAVRVEGLTVDVASLSVGAGGTATFTLEAGAANANQIYWLFGSFSGTAPGTTINGVNIPLNVDAYTVITLSSPNILPLVGTFGFLSPSGSATSQIVIPPGTNPNLAGFSVDHAAAIVSTSTFKVIDASNSASFSFVP